MSYNIDTVKVKKLENFVIPIKSLYESERKDWHPKQPALIDYESNRVIIFMGCGQSISGLVDNGNIKVEKMDLVGEGSGSLMYYVLKNAFEKSTGIFEAVMIWEHGDSVTKFCVEDGKVTEVPYEL